MSCQRQGTEHDVSRRLLQSNQPTSTTTNPPSPGRDRRRSASSSRWIWRRPPNRVGAPSASSTAHPGGITASTCARASRPERRLSPDASRALTNQGPSGKPAQRLSLDDTRRCRVCSAGIRTLERAIPRLDPPVHLLSRSRGDIGWRARHHRSRASRGWIATTRPHRANPRPANRKRPTSPRSASPRTTSSR